MATFIHPPHTVEWPGAREAAVAATPPFCKLEGSIVAQRSYSRFELWLPARAAWNGRFLGLGAGGPYGFINTGHLAAGVNRGFASVATDNGHRSPGRRDDMQWALDEPERVIDFGHRAHHRATVAAKAIVAAHYGKPALRSYFYGCSQGGQKGLSEALLYPDDYDGIAAGAPVYSWSKEAAVQLWACAP